MVRGLISQALENLLSNSVYWLQQGMRDGDEQRTIRVELDSKALTINVWDNGPGIDPRYGKEIFRPYYSTRKKGKGLGLYIASELVEYHGGSLYLDETPEADGRLRTFVIELPKEEK
ncbi:ATP-binding protein [Streptomyces goshikiensis]